MIPTIPTIRCARAALLGLLVACTAHAAEVPAWVRALPAPAADTSSAAANVLLIEHRVAVLGHGQVRESERGAIVVRRPTGRGYAACIVPYERGTSEVLQIQAWLLPPHGLPRELERPDVTDYSLLGAGVLLSDERALWLGAPDAPDGSVFAYEWTKRDTPLMAQWVWSFVRSVPVARSRFELELPEGADAEAVGAPRSVLTTHVGSRWSWEMSGLPAWEEKPLGPETPGADRTLRVSARCHAGALPAGAEFASWQEVGGWGQRLSEPQAALDDAIVARARGLTAGAATPLARARAIAAFVQSTNYVALNLGLGLGFGYRPRPATEVLRTGYGDCKDKANLMKALLKAAGMDAWLVAAYAGDRHHVQPEWPTMCQFNHCIVALRAPPGTTLPAGDPASPLGPVVYFDPTDPCTGFGDLPVTLQGSYGLLQSAQVAPLVRLPVAAETTSVTRRRIQGVLAADGALTGEWVESESGAPAARTRCRLHASEARFRADDAGVLAAALKRADIASWVVQDRPDSARCERRIRFDAPGFARRSGASLMSFNASVIPADVVPALLDTARTEPIDLDPVSFDGAVTLELPAGWKADELPDDRRIARDFGSVEAAWKAEGGRLTYHCRLRTEPVRVPANRYGEVREFLAAVRAVESAPVVLTRP